MKKLIIVILALTLILCCWVAVIKGSGDQSVEQVEEQEEQIETQYTKNLLIKEKEK